MICELNPGHPCWRRSRRLPPPAQHVELRRLTAEAICPATVGTAADFTAPAFVPQQRGQFLKSPLNYRKQVV